MKVAAVLVGLVALALNAQGEKNDDSGGVYWRELNAAGPEPRTQAMIAYCEVLDVMLLSGGYTQSRVLPNSTWAYSFETEEFQQLEGIELPGRRFGSLVNIDPHPSMPDSCRFALFGGSLSTQTISDNDEDVYIIEVTKDPASNSSLVKFEADVYEAELSGPPITGRFAACATGYQNNVYMMGGIESTISGDLYKETMVRLSLLDDELVYPLDANASYPAEWLEVASVPPHRYSFATAMQGDSWVIYGGRGVQVNPSTGRTNDVARSDVRSYDLGVITEQNGLPLSDNNSPTAAFEFAQSGDRLYRIGHVGAVLDDYFFVYGGSKLITSATSNRLAPNDFVHLTRMDRDAQTISCRTGDDETVTWCGFNEEFPFTATNVITVQRKDTMVVYSAGSSTGLLSELNLTSVLQNGRSKFLDGQALNDAYQGFDLLAMKALEYSLVAVCMFLLLSIGVLFRQRRDLPMTMGQEVKKSTGVTKAVIRDLDFVKFNSEGNHVPVIVEWSEEEEPVIVEELPALDASGATTSTKDPTSDSPGVVPIPSSADVEVEVKSDEATQSKTEKQYNFDDEEGELCAICLVPFDEEELLMRLPCKHLFHWDCVEPWLQKNGTCPQCRKHVVSGVEVVPQSADQGETNSTSSESAQDIESQEEAERTSNLVPGNHRSSVSDEDEQMAAAQERLATQRSSNSVSRRVSRRTSLRASARLSARMLRGTSRNGGGSSGQGMLRSMWAKVSGNRGSSTQNASQSIEMGATQTRRLSEESQNTEATDLS